MFGRMDSCTAVSEIEIDAGNVGSARRAGCALVLSAAAVGRRLAGVDLVGHD